MIDAKTCINDAQEKMDMAVMYLEEALAETGITTADEMLYPENLPLVDDLVSYIAIGARSVEDQQHRFVASGIDVPTGMKNPTSGNFTLCLLVSTLHKTNKTSSLTVKKLKLQVKHFISSCDTSFSDNTVVKITHSLDTID